MNNSEILIIFISFVASVMIMMFIMVFLLLKKIILNDSSSRYDDRSSSAIVGGIRDSFEKELENINSELLANKDRWMEVNHLLVSSQNDRNIYLDRATSVNPWAFLESHGLHEDFVEIEVGKIFILTPFSSRERGAFETIREVCNENGFQAFRGDESRADGDIFDQVISHIVSSEIIIANITTRNPNVYYELGIAMALGKNVIMVSSSFNEIPYDLMSKRIVIYEDYSDLRLKLTTALLKTVRFTR